MLWSIKLFYEFSQYNKRKETIKFTNFLMKSYNFLLSSFKKYIQSINYLRKLCPPSTMIKYHRSPVLIPSLLLLSTGSNTINLKLFLIMCSMPWLDHQGLYITKDCLYQVEDTNKNLIIKYIIFPSHYQFIGLKNQSILFSTFMEIVPADFKDTSISNNYHKEHVLLALISKVVA